MAVIVAGARTPIGTAAGFAEGLLGRRPGRIRDQGRAGEGRRLARPGRVRDHGPGAAGRGRADPRPAGRREGGHPDDGSGAHREQGVPVRTRRDRLGRPAHPGRRVRRRGRRRHGVDDAGTAPAHRIARGIPVRRRDTDRSPGPRRPLGCLHRSADGCAHRRLQHSWPRTVAGRSRTRSARVPTSEPRPGGRTACSTTRWCRRSSRSARGSGGLRRGRGHPCRRPPWNRWRNCVLRSTG